MLVKAYDASYYDAGDTAGNIRKGYDDYLRNSDKRLAGFQKALVDIERYAPPPGRLLDF